MRSSSGKKAQFFILTTVVIVGVFYVLSKYLTPYSFIDTSRAVEDGEIFFFNNVKEKAVKTIEISVPAELRDNLEEYKQFVEDMAGEKGYDLSFDYNPRPLEVDIDMILLSQKYTLKSSFTVPRSQP